MSYTPDQMQARVLYRDADTLIFDKPYGLAVHYGTKAVEHLEQFLPYVTFDQAEPPRLAHRLDKDTSGCLVLSRHGDAATRLGRLFLAGRVAKTYWAVVQGRPAAAQGQIDLPLLKVKIPGCSKVVVTALGKPALTDWALLGSDGARSWLELTPQTGRMHQIRAHCAYVGMPILGDPIYGAEMPSPLPLHLLARHVALPDGAQATAPVPAHMEHALTRCGWRA